MRCSRRAGPTALRAPAFLELTDASAPGGLDLLLASDKHRIEPLVRAYEPDLILCWGFPWKIPQAALDVPRLGAVNMHPALLPRHRGPIPLAWALRDGDDAWGKTWHRMDAELDTGNLLVQGTVPIDDDDVDIQEFGAKLRDGALDLLPRALERVAAGDPGDPQPTEGASWAGHFEDDDYVRIDWSQPGAGDPQPGARLASRRSTCPVSGRRSPGSTATRSSSSRRVSPIPAAGRGGSSAATGPSGSWQPSRSDRDEPERTASRRREAGDLRNRCVGPLSPRTRRRAGRSRSRACSDR